MMASISILTQHLAQLDKQLGQIPWVTSQRLQRRLLQLQHSLKDDNIDRLILNDKINRLAQAIDAALALQQQRLAVPLHYDFSPELPISQHLPAIAEALNQHQVIILAGETGSGKTTQLPKLALHLGFGNKGLIGHTQPRRLAAQSVARRLAEELQTPVGNTIGYQLRFTDQTNPLTRVKVMTDGILLAEIADDADLRRYDFLIIDEAHERSLNIDFLLGYLKRLLPRRTDLKIVITSATIDIMRFSQYFALPGQNGQLQPAPVIEVSGRSFPVEIRYRPLNAQQGNEDLTLPQAIAQVLTEITQHEKKQAISGARDVLVFLSGEAEIRQVADFLRRQQWPHTQILPLYARLANIEQQRIFAPHIGRNIILATNIAETSLTVPGIRYVIDCGWMRLSRYNPRSKVQRLPIEPISQASAEQRKGRCGRIAPGICWRLYSEADFLNRALFTEPEILRTNLATVILAMLSWQLGAIENFPFLDMPAMQSIRDGFQLLTELKAVNNQRLTALGKRMARLPIDVRLAAMLLAAADKKVLHEALIIVSALAIQDPRERPLEHRASADLAHQRWQHKNSDFVSWLNLWQAYGQIRDDSTQAQLRQWCRQNFVNYLRMREWHQTFRQLRQIFEEFGYSKLPALADELNFVALHQALLTGLLGHIGLRLEKNEFLGIRQRKFFLHPSSALAKHPPKWLMAFEMVETSRLYGREAAILDPLWLIDIAAAFLKHHYHHPHWEKQRGQVLVWENITLWGLPIVQNRKVVFSKIDQQKAHEIFLREALLLAELNTQGQFLAHNKQQVAEVAALEDRLRRRDLLVNDEQLYQFYAKRVPATITDQRSFEKWRREAERLQADLLFCQISDLQTQATPVNLAIQFPNYLFFEQMQLPLSYHFAPGAADDGITLTVPLAILPRLSLAQLDWLVPGLQREKAIALLKGLPKAYRREVVPIPDWVDAALAAITPEKQMMGIALGEFLRQKKGTRIPAELWQQVNLPMHLRFNYRVVDGKGQCLAESHDLAALQQQLIQPNVAVSPPSLAPLSPPLTWQQWPSIPIEEEVTIEQAGIQILCYRALVDQRDHVAVQIFDQQNYALHQHRRAVQRLLQLAMKQQYGQLLQSPTMQQLALAYTTIGNMGQWRDDFFNALTQQRFGRNLLVYQKEQFEQLLVTLQQDFTNACQSLISLLQTIFTQYQTLRKTLKRTRIDLTLALTFSDAQEQLSHLMQVGFMSRADIWLIHYPRYLQAIAWRLAKASQRLRQDQLAMVEIQNWQKKWQLRCADYSNEDCYPDWLNEFGWLLEEWRVSLFAQQLGTVTAVSAKRLAAFWQQHQV